MRVLVICPDTIFGEIVKFFDDVDSALDWVKICLANDVACRVEIE